jgi:peptide/nickel transport system substrate-binding protein
MGPDDIDTRRRRLLQTLAAAGVSVSLAGCSSDSSTSTPTSGGGDDTATPTESFQAQGPGDRSWISGTTSGAQSLNPLEVSDEATNNRLNLLYDPGSVTIDGLEFEGRMLEEYEISSDSTSATYVLRDDLEWGAGYGQVTADDYVSFVNNIVFGGPDEKTGIVGYSQTSSYILGGEKLEIEKLGRLEFRVNLPQSRGFWLVEDPIRTAYVVPAALIEKYMPFEEREVNGETASVLTQIGNDEAIIEGELSGNLGPFNFESWDQGQQLVVSKNDDYYLSGTELDGLGSAGPNLDDFTYQVFDEQSTAYSAVRAGDITATGVEGRKVADVSSSDGVQMWETDFGEGTFFVSLNHRANGWAPIRESREVRQALAHLIDKNVLIDQIFSGYGDPISTFHEAWGPFYPDDVPQFETSLEQARSKLENGTGSDYGYDGDTFLGPDGEQVELKLVIDNTSQTGEIVGNYINQQLGEVGISANIEGTSFGRIIGNYLQNSVDNNPNYSGEPSYQASGFNNGAWNEAIGANSWDLIYGVGFSGNPFSPWGTIRALLPTESQFNFMGYTPDFDIGGTATAAATASSPEGTRENMNELFTFLAEDQPLTWLFSPRAAIAYRRGAANLPEADSFWDRPDVRASQLRTME